MRENPFLGALKDAAKAFLSITVFLLSFSMFVIGVVFWLAVAAVIIVAMFYAGRLLGIW